MNLEICEKHCNIDAIQIYLCNNIDIKLCDKSFKDRFDLPCQKYSHKHELNPKIIYKPKNNKHFYNCIAFNNDERLKWCQVPKTCPYYAEHLIYDEN